MKRDSYAKYPHLRDHDKEYLDATFRIDLIYRLGIVATWAVMIALCWLTLTWLTWMSARP